MNAEIQPDVLLVEDNPRDAELTLRTLRKHNLVNSIVHLRDGQAALDWFFGANDQFPGRCPKIVLLDLKLPKVDGLEVLRALRADERTRRQPVVVMTSSCEDRDVNESYGLGVNSFIVKPVDFDSFSAVVAELGHYWLVRNHDPGPLDPMH
jgi:CheY-like chemotaxis protein